MRAVDFYGDGLVILFLALGSAFDIKSKEIPEIFLVLSVAGGVLWNLLLRPLDFREVLTGIGLGILFLILGRLTGEAIGYGDGYAILILGIFQGGKRVMGIVCIAFVLGALYGGLQMIRKKSSLKDTMPFYPFLLLAEIGALIL